MYGTGFMSERFYKEQTRELIDHRGKLQTELSETEVNLEKQPKLSVAQLVAGAQKMLGSLGFTDKKAILRRIVTNIKATQENVITWAQLPVLVKAKVGFEPQYRHSRVAERW